MKRKIWLLALVGAVLLSAGTAWAQADFYVIAGGGSVGTRITSLPYIISNPGFYFLGSNLSYNGTGNAITVNVDNVTIDLMGFNLTNAGGNISSTYGIYLNGRTNVEIRNGTVSGFYSGIDEVSYSGSKHRAINVRAINNQYGIVLYGNNHLTRNCQASDNAFTGLYVTSGLITDCIASANTNNIIMVGPGSVLGNIASNGVYNFTFPNAGATSILVDRNSAFGSPNSNYEVFYLKTGVVFGTNAG